jgi:hypothetical protein
MKEGTLPDDPKRAHAIPHEASQYVLMNDVLYHLFTKRLRKKVKETDIIQQLAVPTSLRNDVLLSYHDSIAAGCHMGVQKTYEAVRQKYFWPEMYQHIYDYITSCKTCQMIKRNTHVKRATMYPLPVQDVFARWQMDILAGLPKTKDGYQYILLLIGSSSHWCECVPLTSQDSVNVAKVLYNGIFTIFGMPGSILSDRGHNFMSKLVSALCAIFQVTKLRTSSFHPQTNGICERQNSALAQCRRAYCHENQENWTKYLRSIMMSLRMTLGLQTTGFSPFEILFGRNMKLPIDFSLVPQQNILKAPMEHIKDIIKKIEVTRKIARENLQMVRDEMKEKHDQRVSDIELKRGQYVLLKHDHIAPDKKKKLEAKWTGPYYIISKLNHDTYVIGNCETQNGHSSPVNISRLKIYNDPRDIRPPSDESPEGFFDPIDETENTQSSQENTHQNISNDDTSHNERATQDIQDDNQDEVSQNNQLRQHSTGEDGNTNDKYYPVEKLVKTRVRSGIKEILVRWEGNYPDSWFLGTGTK